MSMYEISIIQLDKIEPHPDPAVERMGKKEVGWKNNIKQQFEAFKKWKQGKLGIES